MRFLLLLPLLAGGLVGCRQDVTDDRYQPLEAGLSWQYQRTEVSAGQRKVSRFVIENLRHQVEPDLGIELASTPVTVRHTSDGTDYYLYADMTGVYRVGHRTLIEYYPQLDVEPQLVIPAADELQSSITWTRPSRSYLIHSVHSSVAWNPAVSAVTMTWEIAATDEMVEVAAGRFEHCLKLEGHAEFGMYVDPKQGFRQIEINQTEWYAPDVGLVKLVREEPLDMDMFQGGSLTFELIRFDDGSWW